ncbi:MAG TPA: hypothetical protein VJT31_25765, partial [Rugosimonospora sp.]|nr:hypothetical protein [Rugosimonospora sp.]
AATVLPAADSPTPEGPSPAPPPMPSAAARTGVPASPTHAAPPVTHATAPAKPRKSPTKAPPATCGAPANPFGFTFCGGSYIYLADLPSDVCSYFDCIDNFWNGKGYLEECKDGRYSMSGGRSGACSYHGGELRPVYRH